MKYIYFLKLGFLHPKKFAKLIAKDKSLSTAFFFGAANLSLGLILQIIIKMVVTGNLAIFFPEVSEALSLVVLMLVLFVFLGLSFGLIAKLFGGGAGLKSSMIVTFYSTGPLILAFLPEILFIGLIWSILLLTAGFYYLHEYSKTKAFVNISIPIMGLVIAWAIFSL